MIDYDVLRVIWWLLLGVLLIGFAIMDGFDMGAAMLLPFVGKTDIERRIIINTFAPVWEGNQVWLILGAGAIFAAWPMVYAVAFSSMYLAMFLAVLGLIARPVVLTFRSKSNNTRWRTLFDSAICISSFLPAFIFGVAIGNALIGIPFHFDESLRVFYTGSFFELLNPYSLVCGIVSLAMMVMQGGVYILLKVNDPALVRRAKSTVFISITVLLTLFTLVGFWNIYRDGYIILQESLSGGPSNPLMKMVVRAHDYPEGSPNHCFPWLENYVNYPLTLCAPLLVYLSGVQTKIFVRSQKNGLAFISSSLCVVGLIATVGMTMFPFILPSSSHSNSSLTVWDASSSKNTLEIMLIVTVIFIPIIITYTGWVYRVLRGKVTADSINENQNSY